MPKDIKKHFRFMDLSYSSSVEDVKEREKVMIKIERAKAIKKQTSQKDKINKIVNSSNIIVDYIEKNGVSNIKDGMFSTPTISIVSQLIVLVSLLMFLGFVIFSLI